MTHDTVLTASEAAVHPHNVARETFIEIEETLQPAPAPRFSVTPSATPTAPPLPGEHNDEALHEWGFDDGEIAQLMRSGAIG